MDQESKFITPMKSKLLDNTYAWSCFKTPVTPVIFSSSSDEDEQDENVPHVNANIVANLEKHAAGKGNICGSNDSESRKKSNSFVTDANVLKLTSDFDEQLHIKSGNDRFVKQKTPKSKIFRRIVPYSDDEDEDATPSSPVRVFDSSPEQSVIPKENHNAVKSSPDTNSKKIVTPIPRKLKPIVLLSDEEESPSSLRSPLVDRNSTVLKSPPGAAGKLVTPTPRKLKPIVLLSDDEESPEKTPLFTVNSIFPVQKTPKLVAVSSNFVQSKTRKKLSFLKTLSPAASPSISDPEGLKYRKNYSWVKEHLACKLYKLYNEAVFDNQLPKDLPLEWNPLLTSTAGYFLHGKCKAKICLSSKVLTTAYRLRDTLLHEMCHAAVHFIDRKRDKHGPIWKSWAAKCKVAFPEIPMPTRCHRYSLNYRYKFACTGCGVTFGKHRLKLSFDITRKCCRHCGSKFKQLFM